MAHRFFFALASFPFSFYGIYRFSFLIISFFRSKGYILHTLFIADYLSICSYASYYPLFTLHTDLLCPRCHAISSYRSLFRARLLYIFVSVPRFLLFLSSLSPISIQHLITSVPSAVCIRVVREHELHSTQHNGKSKGFMRTWYIASSTPNVSFS